MVPDDRNPWCKVDVEDKDTGVIVKVTLWCEKQNWQMVITIAKHIMTYSIKQQQLLKLYVYL